ncbi:52 kDa repressor of the inhibitor of the protein kinase-like [Cardiocondyla obscurior]|uniref:52 kDa repressor of the inhibitor of the protein kinase-like n=1 Tax=Cardiocondyla obscurior TaxID=286306 RepID=UPI0039657496
MAGKYSGLQARIKEKCKFAIFVPCAAHSLNLVGVHTAGCVLEVTSFFQLVQNLYNFFSSSTYRWNILTECLSLNKVIKCLSETRWSARADAVSALHRSYKQILKTLISIANDTDQPGETRNEALSLTKKMGKLFTFLANFIGNVRNNFDQYKSSAKKNFPDVDYKDLSQRIRTRSSRIAFYDGSAETVQMTGKEKFKTETFLPMIDTLITHLKQRSDSCIKFNQLFGFLSCLKTIKLVELKNSCKEFGEMYHDDVNAEELEVECLHLTQYLQNVRLNKDDNINISELYHLLRTDKIEDTFPNVAIALRIFLSLMISNCSGKRSFSKLNKIKNELRSTMLQDRLNSLSLMSIKSDILKEIDFEEIINDFAHQKSRKKPLLK